MRPAANAPNVLSHHSSFIKLNDKNSRSRLDWIECLCITKYPDAWKVLFQIGRRSNEVFTMQALATAGSPSNLAGLQHHRQVRVRSWLLDQRKRPERPKKLSPQKGAESDGRFQTTVSINGVRQPTTPFSKMTVERAIKRNGNIVRYSLHSASRVTGSHEVERLQFARQNKAKDFPKICIIYFFVYA